MNAPDLLAYFRQLLPMSLTQLKELVELESHSSDKPGVDALARDLAARFRLHGMDAQVLPVSQSGDVLHAVWRSGSAGKPVLLLGHLDTVWPPGTIRERPFRIKGGQASGPGIYDMKAGLLLCLLAARALGQKMLNPGRDVIFLFTGDEETGTRGGLPHIRKVASGCRAVLCLEPPLPGGNVKTFRKGVGVFKLRVRGVAAHAGVEPEKGANAILELSRQVVRLSEMDNRKRGTTVTVGTITGGAASNVVPAEAEAEIDVRVVSVAEGETVEGDIRQLRPCDERCTLEVSGGMNRPPLERTAAVLDLYERARRAALELGWSLGEGGTGGGSDGSFTAAMGIPTLDGLGVDGAGAHAVHECIEIEDIPRRAALLCRIMESLD